MSKFITVVLDAVREFLNGISNTVWGLLIIFICMRLLTRGINVEAAYYFAGVGSTLLGIKSTAPTINNNSVVNSDMTKV